MSGFVIGESLYCIYLGSLIEWTPVMFALNNHSRYSQYHVSLSPERTRHVLNINHIHIEKELLLRIAQGDEEAFTILFDCFRDPLFSWAVALTRSHTVASDILQEVFLKIWTQRTSLLTIGNMHGYLVTTTRNVLLNELRRLERVKTNESRYGQNVDTHTGPDLLMDHLQNKQVRAIIEKAVAQLSGQQAAVFRLIKEQGYTRDEAARELHLSPETVKKHLERAMRTIRGFLLAHFGDALILLYLFLKYSDTL